MEKSKFFVQGILCLIFSLSMKAQTKKYELEINDRVPNIQIGRLINYKSTYVRSSDFKDKLLILDFWGTFCKPCIEQFPKYEKLQQEFGNKIQVLLVAPEKADRIIPFWKANKVTSKLTLPSVVGDTMLVKYFPFESMPHLVWIYKGVVKAITTYEYMKSDRIKAVLSDEPVNWPIKTDAINYDYDKPYLIFAGNGLAFTPNPIYYTTLTGYLDGNLKSFSKLVRDTQNKRTRVYIINQPIDLLYRNALNVLGDNRDLRAYTIMEISDSSRFNQPKGGMDANITEWDRKNAYSFEAILPLNSSQEELKSSVFSDLNKFLNLNGRFERRKVNCYVLRKVTNEFRLQEEEYGLPMGIYISNLYESVKEPIVDETGLTGKYKVRLDQSSIENLKISLKSYGLELIQEKRELELLVIGEK